ncbi:MAG: hypothetical protein RTV72_13710 [Candidatus Thorarchaeota archaeon]
MLRRNVLTIMMCFLVLFSVSNIMTPAAAHRVGSTSTTNDLDASVRIIDAYYSNEDGDVDENDIVGCFNIILNGAQRYCLDIHISLTMPSGVVHTFSQAVNGSLTTLHCTIFFYDYGTESGDYTLTIEVQVNNCGTCYDSAEYVFDPPGGSGDTDPLVYLVI